MGPWYSSDTRDTAFAAASAGFNGDQPWHSPGHSGYKHMPKMKMMRSASLKWDHACEGEGARYRPCGGRREQEKGERMGRMSQQEFTC